MSERLSEVEHQQAIDLSREVIAFLRVQATGRHIGASIVLSAVSLAGLQIAYSYSVDGHELDAIREHRDCVNHMADQLIEMIAEGKL